MTVGMWETPAPPASSKRRCEEWDSFTVPRFARPRHFHGHVLRSSPEGNRLIVEQLRHVQ